MNDAANFIVRVIEEYQAPFPDPIRARAGEEVIVDLRKETDIAGWVWCTNHEGKSGWVPKLYVETKRNQGWMLQEYNAIELTIHVGDILKVHKEESSFYWVTNQVGEQGWVPIANIEVMEAEV